MEIDWNEIEKARLRGPLFHGSEDDFQQFGYQQRQSTGVGGAEFGTYLSSDLDTALKYANDKNLYQVEPDFMGGRAIQVDDVTLSGEEVAHLMEILIKDEIKEDHYSYFLADEFAGRVEITETNTWTKEYEELTRMVATDMVERAPNDMSIVNDLYNSFGGGYSDTAATLLGKGLKEVGVTYSTQTRLNEQGKVISEFVIYQPEELVIRNKLNAKEVNQNLTKWKEQEKMPIKDPLFHGSEKDFQQFAYQKNHSTGISGLGFGVYLSNDRETALRYAQDKQLYEVEPNFVNGRALQANGIALTEKDVSHLISKVVNYEVQEDGVSYFLTNRVGEVAMNATDTRSNEYQEIENIVAAGLIENASNDIDIVNDLYQSIGGDYSDMAAEVLGEGLKEIGITHSMQTRLNERGEIIQEFVVYQPEELVIRNKLNALEVSQNLSSGKEERELEAKPSNPIVIPTPAMENKKQNFKEQEIER
ncbi:hypothetical protein [Listeria seeligeri]|uniref:hypothetical protein n=1 Tax=Listeria seeligeri TaxID=1640 RepID=UPI0016233039|nr:hypothetical protein [Listeria seeligeri]MBC1917048.1 hypothetical protein [Listeria seeligeri]MBC1990393.1 hypothetical protein [Listeria seeligeri]MBF2375206.1 hypothetical protein [Listeria seeligeri]UCK61877.1 hypothetical protein pLIS51_00361c [Listeria seeligeri]